MVGWRCSSSALDRGERSASCPGHFTPWGKSSQYPLGRKQVWILWRTENLAPAGNRTPAHSPSLYRLSYPESVEGNAEHFNAKTISTHSNRHSLRGWTPCIPELEDWWSQDHSTSIWAHSIIHIINCTTTVHLFPNSEGWVSPVKSILVTNTRTGILKLWFANPSVQKSSNGIPYILMFSQCKLV